MNIKFKILLSVFFVLIFAVAFAFVARKNFKWGADAQEQAPLPEVESETQASGQEEAGLVEKSIDTKPSTEETSKEENVSESQVTTTESTPAASEEEEVTPPAQVEKKIHCDFKAEWDNHIKSVVVKWNCKDIYGWSCDLKIPSDLRKKGVNYENVSLPSGTAKVDYNTKVCYYGGYGSSRRCKTGMSYYEMKCESISGKINNYDAAYYD